MHPTQDAWTGPGHTAHDCLESRLPAHAQVPMPNAQPNQQRTATSTAHSARSISLGNALNRRTAALRGPAAAILIGAWWSDFTKRTANSDCVTAGDAFFSRAATGHCTLRFAWIGLMER
jgi:hypothetical protein